MPDTGYITRNKTAIGSLLLGLIVWRKSQKVKPHVYV